MGANNNWSEFDMAWDFEPPSVTIGDLTRDRSADILEGEILDRVATPGGKTHREAHEEIKPSEQPLSYLPPVLRHIDFEKVKTRRDMIFELCKYLPLNEYNLPMYFYRADLLEHPDPLRPIEDVQANLESATVYINYHQGFPTLSKDRPFWAKFEYETQEAFDAFKLYLEIRGARTTHKVVELYREDLVEEWYSIYYWRFRSLAYDMFTAAHHHRMREHRIFELQDAHYARSERIFGSVVAALEAKTPEDWDKEKPKDLVAIMSTLADVQRKALSIGPSGASEAVNKNTPIEAIMKQSAETSSPTIIVDDDNNMASLLADPDMLDKAQDLIIEVNKR